MNTYLQLKSISKSFGSLVANDSIDLTVKKGEIHAIIGENGAGKSTLMNVLSGIHQPDSGEILINGKAQRFANPTAANRAGIGMVHQEFMLFPELSVLDNIIMGFEQTAIPCVIGRRKSEKAVREICEKYNFNVPLSARADTLPVAVLQQVEIVKVLYHGADIIIFDEPTSVLTPQGIEGLFKAFRALTEKDKTILFITHKLQEVLAVADSITVLKDGRVTCHTSPDKTDEKELARMMVGRDVLLTSVHPEKAMGEDTLRVENLNVLDEKGKLKVRDVSFSVKAGEIVGIAGIAGSGERELIASLFGLIPSASGKVWFKGESIEKLSTRERRKLGIGYVPQDRNAEGANRGASLWENCMMGYHVAHGFKSKWLIDHKEIYEFTRQVVENYSVKAGSIFSNVGELSGGNVQKLIVGREFMQKNDLLIIEDPTRGIDIGAIEFIWAKIQELAAAGVSVLMVSHELNEVMELSDRILVMYDGRLIEAGLHGEKSEEEIGILMTGGQEE